MSLNFKEYEKLAITTKIYKDEVALMYVTLGLCGEVSEMVEKGGEVRLFGSNPKSKEEFLKEVGDVLWYMAAIRQEFNLTSSIDFPEYDPTHLQLLELDKLLNSAVILSGAIAEQMKKALRDNDGIIDSVREAKIQDKWETLFKVIDGIANFVSVPLPVIAQQNIDKLASRQKRNVIKGSGDNR